MLEPGKLHDLNIKIPILKYQTVGSSDFVNDLKFPIEKKLMLLRKVPRNYENQLRCFMKHHRPLDEGEYTNLKT